MAITSGKIRFAVVGSGRIGKRHAAMITRNEECELVALCDIKPRSELGLEAFSEAPFFSSIEELLATSLEIDVVCICTPNGYHAQQSILALEAHKHIVCEKPMGLTKASCEQVIFKALNVSKQVFCVMQNRYSPPSMWIKEVVDKGILGQILLVQINCFWNRDRRYYYPNGTKHAWKGNMELDGGTLFTQFSHFVDIMYWLFGDIRNIQTRMVDFSHQESTDFEDSGLVQFDFVNGGFGSITFSTSVWDKNYESSLTVIGSQGTIKIGGQYMEQVEYCHIEGYEMPELPPTNPANDYGTHKGSAANHHYIIQNVVDVLKGRREVTTNALEGLKVVDIIERIYEGADRPVRQLEAIHTHSKN